MAKTMQTPEDKKASYPKRQLAIMLSLLFALLLLMGALCLLLPETMLGAGRTTDYSGLVISEVMAANSTVTLDAVGLRSDYAEFCNASSKTVDLSGYGLSDTRSARAAVNLHREPLSLRENIKSCIWTDHPSFRR